MTILNKKQIGAHPAMLGLALFSCNMLLPFTPDPALFTTLGLLGITLPKETPFADTYINRNQVAQAVAQNSWAATGRQRQQLAQDLTNGASQAISQTLQNHDFNFQTKRAVLICAVPIVLHTYDRASILLFNTALSKLKPESTAHNIVQTTRDIRHWLVINPVTQIALTQVALSYLHRS